MIWGIFVSPFTTASHAMGSEGVQFPSTKTSVTQICDCSIRRYARSIARMVACRMLISSISALLDHATAQDIACSLISVSKSRRRRADSCLESRNSAQGKSGGSTTAAAHTGPAIGPRPASSIPQTSST